jgi:hypothetical protein
MREFLLNTFFKNERFSGWKGIAENLIDKGECIVAGTDCIWKGGIGNFIKVEEANDLIGCIKYIFDYNDFVSKDNLFFMEYYTPYLEDLKYEAEKIEKEIKSLKL